MAKLIVDQSGVRSEVRLGSNQKLGRNPSCAVVLADAQVSGVHCVIALDSENRFVIEDLGSRNGTYVNGMKIAGHTILRHGDDIQVGQTRCIFIEDNPTAADVVQLSEAVSETSISARVSAQAHECFLPAGEVKSAKAMRSDYERLRLAYELHRLLGSDMELDAVLGRILDRSFDLLHYDHGVVLISDVDGNLQPRAYRNRSGYERIIVSSTLLDIVKKEKTSLLSVNVQDDERFRNAASIILQGVRSTIAVPILSREELLGIIIIDSTSRINAFTQKDVELMTAIASHTAQHIKNSLLHAELRASFESSMSTLAATVDARHPLTAGHSQRVTDYSVMIGEEMGLERRELEVLKYSALLHDIGKVGIRDSVLLKNGPFAPEERAEMNSHPEKTRSILENFRFPTALRLVPHIAACHHEKINGQGYPRGLSGDSIPLLSRIIAVADVFDALTSARDYPKYDAGNQVGLQPLPLPRVLEIIKDNAGQHFDTRVVNTFLKCLPRLLRKQRGTHFAPEYVDAMLDVLAFDGAWIGGS